MKMHSTLKALLFWAALLAALFVSSGCSLVTLSSSTEYRDQEGAFRGALLNSIQPQVTSEDWLFKHFGEPTFTDTSDDGKRLLTWPFMLEKHSRRRVFLLFESHKTYREPRFLHVISNELQTVTAAWVDLTRQPTQKAVLQALESAQPVFMYDPSLLSASGVNQQGQRQQAPVIKNVDSPEATSPDAIESSPDSAIEAEIKPATGEMILQSESDEPKSHSKEARDGNPLGGTAPPLGGGSGLLLDADQLDEGLK